MLTSSALFFVYLVCVGSVPTSKYSLRHDEILVEQDYGRERAAYEELAAYQAGLSMSLSMSMSMSFDYGRRHVSRTGLDSLQPVSIDNFVSSSAPTAKVTTAPSVGSVGSSVDVSVREVVVEKETAVNAGTLGGRRNGDSDHPNIFVVLSITAATVVAVVVARKIGQAHGRNAKTVGSDLSHSAMEATVSECV